MRNKTAWYIGVAIVLHISMLFILHGDVSAVQTVPYKMNFQGRLTDSTGTPKADGVYNMKFRIYDASSGGTLQWSEERAVSASTGVSVVNGLFSVQLGEVSSLSPSLFTTQNLYLEVELPTPATATCTTGGCASYAEGPMTPRNKFGSSAYAFNSDTIDGIDGANIGQLNANNSWTGTNVVSATSTAAFQVQKAAGADVVLSVNTTDNRLVIGNANSATGADVTLLVVDSGSSSAIPTGTPGAMYFDTTNNVFKCYTTTWVNCDTTGAGGGQTRRVVMVPEFANGTIQADGSNNGGVMNSGFSAGLSAGQGYKHQYYQWTSSNTATQDYNIYVGAQIPSDYASSLANLKIWGYSSDTSLATATIQFTDHDGTNCYASPVSFTPSTASTWEQISVGAMTGCSFAANDIATVTIVVYAKSSAVFRVGEISYEYTN